MKFDVKGRIILPSKVIQTYRKRNPDQEEVRFSVVSAFHPAFNDIKYLTLLDSIAWEKYTEGSVPQLTKPNVLKEAEYLGLGSLNRFLIPLDIRKDFKRLDDVTLIGNGELIEIYSKEDYLTLCNLFESLKEVSCTVLRPSFN